MDSILQVVLPVFAIIALGFIIGKFRKFNVQPLIDLVVYIAAPCLIITSVTSSNISMTDFLTVALSALGIITILALIVFVALKKRKSDKTGLFLPVVIGNSGYLGYPIALLAYGVDGLSRAVIFDMMNSLFLFSIGIYLLQRKNGWKEAFKIPLIYAVVLGLIFNLFNITIPAVVFKPIEMIGSISIPLALLVLGYKLTEVKLTSFKTALIASLTRIVGGFLIGLMIVFLFSITGIVRNVILIQAAMPSAIMSMILTAKYKKDANLAASIVFLTTVISVITLPLILWIVSVI
jgi:malate permease and related proteins